MSQTPHSSLKIRSSLSAAGKMSPLARIVAVDSDGTVLDAMTIKHRECFTPALIAVWGLEAIAPRVTEKFLHINLHSVHRGVNRFEALGLILREIRGTAAGLPSLDAFFEWLESSTTRSESTLTEARLSRPDDAGLRLALAWSVVVNLLCARLPPPAAFLGARAALIAAARVCDVRVVSSGNGQAIRSEWAHAGLSQLPAEFLTQEAGPKATILRQLSEGLRSPTQILMLGDAPPDETAAREVGTLFFPIIPGEEAECWDAFQHEILPAFHADRFGPEDTAPWVRRFHTALGI